MTKTNTISAPLILAESDELIVTLYAHPLDISEYTGRRVTLEGEGIIPTTTIWPEGYDDLRWQDGKIDFWLRRQRPEGAKGPRRQFANCDWWCLRWSPSDEPDYAERSILHKTKILQNAIYAHSAIGRSERNKEWASYWRSLEDEKFQQFKTLLPGFVRPKRVRRQSKSDN